MESFVIPSASRAGSLEFFERTPHDPALPIERFKVKLIDLDLSAVARVYVARGGTHPAPLIALLSESWRGWHGEFTWESPEGELALRCTQDRGGHVSIGVELRSGPTPGDWTVRSTVMAEAGQLQAIAQRAELFFGRLG